MWIRSHDGQVHNSRYVAAFTVRRSQDFHCRPMGSGWITHPGAPRDGHCVVGWDSKTLPTFLTSGLPEAEANAVLQAICQALGKRQSFIDLNDLTEGQHDE